MGPFRVGDVVSVRFPFSDLRQTKLRPALVLAKAEHENIILCQITSKPYASDSAITLTSADFATGKLPLTSYIRPDKLFTADYSIVTNQVGHLNPVMQEKALNRVRQLFTTGG